MPDKDYIDYLIQKKTESANTITVGMTWVDGQILFKHNSKQSQAWYGICHYGKAIAIITPLDYDAPTMISSILVAPVENYCERASSCLYFDCSLNKFDVKLFLKLFKDVGGSSLGMPLDMGTKSLWFNEPKYKDKWKDFILPVEGGKLQYDEERGRKLGIG